MARFWVCLGFVAVVFGTLLSTPEAYQWQESPEALGTVHVCAGDHFTLVWILTPEEGETIVDVEWLHQPPGQENISIAGFIDKNFVAGKDRISFVPNVGITVRDSVMNDTGDYFVKVRIHDVDCESLVVAEQHASVVIQGTAPKTEDGKLHVSQRVLHGETGVFAANGEPLVQLKCGPFIDQGEPSVDPVWTLPSGEEVSSSFEDDGEFVLALPAPVQPGNYTCSLQAASSSSHVCLADDSPLRHPASLYLDEKDSRLAVLETRQIALIDAVSELRQLYNNVTTNHVTRTHYESDQDEMVSRLEDLTRELEDKLKQQTEEKKESAGLCRDHVAWKMVDGLLKSVSVGAGGIWGANRHNSIYFRVGSYNEQTNAGTKWRKVEGLLKQVDVGNDVMWGANHDDHAFYRSGISVDSPTGSGWVHVSPGIKHVTVSPKGYVWAVSTDGSIKYRTGASNSNRKGSGWKRIDGGLKQVSAGPSGVWGVNSGDQIWYRSGTFGDNGSTGTDWVSVPGRLKYISSGDGYVIGVNSNDMIYRREGITASNPTGTSWKQLDGRLKVIDSYGCFLWGVNSNDNIFIGAM